MHDNSARNAFGQTVTTVPTTRPAPSLLEMRGIRFMVPEADNGAGAGGNADAGAGAGAENAQNGGQGSAGGENSAAAGAGTGDDGKGAQNGAQPDGVKFEDLDERTKAFVLRDRQQAATERQTRIAAEQKLTEERKAIAKLLGYEKDEQVDVNAISAKLNATNAENLVLRHGGALVKDVDALLDSRKFAAELEALTNPDKASVTALIEKFANENTAYKAIPADSTRTDQNLANGGSGTGGAGTGGDQGRKVPATLEDAIAAELAGRK